MKKNIIFTFLVLITIFSILIVVLYRTSYSALYADKVLSQDEEIQKAFKNYEIVNCNFSLKNLKHAFVSFQHYVYPEDNSEMKFWRIDFYNLSRNNIFSRDWNIQRTGGTTITNTTFPELVAMVKEDCSQLQEDYDNPKVDEGGIDWGYREAEPPKTQEEIEEERRERANDVREYLLEDYNEEQRERIKEVYGISIESADNDLIEWDNEIIPEDDERLSDVFPEEKGPNRPFDPYLFDDVQVPQQK